MNNLLRKIHDELYKTKFYSNQNMHFMKNKTYRIAELCNQSFGDAKLHLKIYFVHNFGCPVEQIFFSMGINCN